MARASAATIKELPPNGAQLKKFQGATAGCAVLAFGPKRLRAARRPFHDDVDRVEPRAGRGDGA
ncbi:hypothetical protein ABTF53_19745, partial [Acinetobacter baumannii]